MKKILFLLTIIALISLQGKSSYSQSGQIRINHEGQHPLRHKAIRIDIEDAGGFYAAVNVEAALQEIFSTLLPANYLKLDCSNDPLTGSLEGTSANFTNTGSMALYGERTETEGGGAPSQWFKGAMYKIKADPTASRDFVYVASDHYAITESTNTEDFDGGLIGAYASAVWQGTGAKTGTGYGGYFSASGSGGAMTQNIGVYGTASGAATNYAGYFNGDVYSTGKYYIGSEYWEWDSTLTDFVFSDDVIIKDIHPGMYIWNTENDIAFGHHYHMGATYPIAFWRLDDGGVSPNIPLMWFDESTYGVRFPHGNFQVDASGNVIATGTATLGDLEVDSPTLSIDASNNRVGIGTTSPRASLEISGGGNALYIVDGTNTRIVIGDTTDARDYGELRWDTTGNYLGLDADLTQALVLQEDGGNVGIGTATPGRKLDLEGTASAYQEFHATDYNQWAIGSETRGFIFYDDTNDDYRMAIGKTDNAGVSIGTTYASDNEAPSNGLIVEGNVGIGTTDPDEALHIVGDVKIADDTPHLEFEPDAGDHFEIYAYGSELYCTNINDTKVLWRVRADNLFQMYDKYSFVNAAPTDNYILKYDAALGYLNWEADAGAGDNVTVDSTAVDTTADFDSGGTVNFSLADGGAGGPDTITANFDANELVEDSGFTSGDFIPYYDTTESAMNKVDYDDLPSAGATALDDIADPDAATSISMDDNEAITLTSAEDTGTVLTIDITDGDLAGETTGIDIKHEMDGSNLITYIRCYDNSGNDLVFDLGANGNTELGALTARTLSNIIGGLQLGTATSVAGNLTMYDAGTLTMYDNADDFNITLQVNDGEAVATLTGGLDVSGNLEGGTITEGGNAVPNATDHLGFFGGTTSAELYGELSDETGSGAGSPLAVFNQNPSIVAATLTGDINAGGADLELPQGQTPDTDGDVDLDFTDGKLVIQHGSAHAELGAATDVVMGSLIKSWTAILAFPDTLQAEQDNWMFKTIESSEFPHGVVITSVTLKTPAASSYALNVENWDDPDTINGANPTIVAVATSASQEATESSITYATIAAGQIIKLDLDTDDVAEILVQLEYYEPISSP